jgi:tetratricopeptide (TPR) repeat protein
MMAKRGVWIDGAKAGLASQGLYKQVKKLDRDHAGADLGLGVFDYYFGTNLKWVPFVAGASVEKGLEAMERSLNAPFPFNYAAKSTYCWMLIDRKEYKKADSLARTVLAENAGNTIFLRIRALTALWTGDYESALKLGGKLIDLSQGRKPANWSDLVSGYYIVASSYDNLGQKDKAHEAADKAIGYNIPAKYKNIPHVKENLKRIAAIWVECRPK